MSNCNDNPKDTNKTITALFAVFSVIVLREAVTGNLSLIWVTLMGVIIISLSLCAILLRVRKSGDMLNDPRAIKIRRHNEH